MKRKIIILQILSLMIFSVLHAQEAHLKYNASNAYILVERTDLRRYDNGKYIGLLSREIRSFIAPEYSDEKGTFYSGNFYVLEKTRRNLAPVARTLNTAIPSIFKIEKDGELIMIEDYGFPSFRSFPSYNEAALLPGDTWSAYAERSVDPLNKKINTKMLMLVEYTFLREEIYHEEEVYVLSAKWASRYGGDNYDPEGDTNLIKVSGKHDATILVSKTNGRSLLIRDQADETFFYSDGKQVTFKGTISMFTEYPPTYNTKDVYKKIENIAKQNERSLNSVKTNEILPVESVKIEKTNAGLRLSMQDLKFRPDSSELLPEENYRLEAIYQMLSECPQSSFLIEGHTASTGNPSGEKELSIERAKAVANHLISKGIPEERIICKGSGSEKPIAENDTPEGKAKNRRVEITILGL